MISSELRRLCEEATQEIADYSVGFARLWEGDDQFDAQVAGSGTLIAAAGTHAILTADHVLEKLPTRGQIGLLLPTRFAAKVERHTVEVEFLEKVRIPRGTRDSDGPDIGVLILPAPLVGTIKSIKSFCNLLKWRDQVLPNPPSVDVGVWCLSGWAHEWTTDGHLERGFEKVKEFRGGCGWGTVTGERTRDGWDFLEFRAAYNKDYEGPESFQGFSGGGLWQLVTDTVGGGMRVTQRLLSGVAFYESPREESQRVIVCHGRNSVYRNIIDALRNRGS